MAKNQINYMRIFRLNLFIYFWAFPKGRAFRYNLLPKKGKRISTLIPNANLLLQQTMQLV